MNRPTLRNLAIAMALTLLPLMPAGASDIPAPDAFKADSFWNVPLGADATRHPNSNNMIDFLMADNDLNGCITLAGTSGNSWGMPLFVADASDTVYNVVSRKWSIPPEFSELRIPQGAVAADTSDGEMVVYDLVAGVVAQLSKAEYSASSDSWTVSGGSVAFLASNGLDGALPQSDEPRNDGTFRGYPASVAMVHYDDIASGALDNVVKIGVNNARDDFVFPMIGSDGDSTHPDAPPEGTRIRIRHDVDLEALGLRGQALTIARGLQQYGMIVGDNTGGAIVLKLEDTIAGGRGDLWDLDRQSLCAIQGSHLEVVVDPGSTSPSGFLDTAGHLFETEIAWLAKTGITYGCGSGRFCPDSPITRGQMAAFLNRALDLPNAPPAGFTDMRGHLFERDADNLFAATITVGCGADRFCPGRLVTRGEMAAFLVRSFNLPPTDSSPFGDIAGSIFKDDIERLAAARITRGCSASKFCPADPITRGEMAAFLMRATEG